MTAQTDDIPSKPIHINLQAIVDERLGKKSRYVPKFLVRSLAKFICQDELNGLLERVFPQRGGDFCKGVLEELDVTVNVKGAENLPDNAHRRFIAVCNHPLGGLDGVAIIDYFSKIYDGHVRFVVNDLLMAVEPLKEVFLPINKLGAQSRRSLIDIDNAMAGDDVIIIFPAGLVSRKGKKDVICDLQWQKMFVNKAVEFERDIIPMYFDGQNSAFFYNFAKWRKRLHIKLNLEMARLPKEVFRSLGKTFTLTIGERLAWQTLANGKHASAEAERIKQIAYNLSNKK